MKKQLHEIAEELVMEIEQKRARNPSRVSKIKGSKAGYDIASEGRHIEVKSSGKRITWKELTHNETQAFKKDTSYYMYLVEFNKENKTADIYAIPKKELLQMAIHKEIVRFSALDSKEKRKHWLLKKEVPYNDQE